MNVGNGWAYYGICLLFATSVDPPLPQPTSTEAARPWRRPILLLLCYLWHLVYFRLFRLVASCAQCNIFTLMLQNHEHGELVVYTVSGKKVPLYFCV